MRSPSTGSKAMSSEEKPGTEGVVVVGCMARTLFSASSTLESDTRVNVSFPSEPTLAFRLPLVTDCPAAVSAALSQSASEKELIMVSAVMTSGLSLKAPPDATARTRTALSPCASILTSCADAASRTMRHDGEAAAEASVAAAESSARAMATSS